MSDPIRLTEYSHGAGCGCKISPAVLSTILAGSHNAFDDPALLVGNATRDDAAAYRLSDDHVILSTTDFFMPIVDDPFDFGRIAATNAISDIYAMGGRPLMAIAILGWPVNVLPPEVAQHVVAGGRRACNDAGIMLAGGHSIDAPEPIFGLAVTGQVQRAHLRQNSTARAGDLLYLTKPLGIGVLTTAQKQKKLQDEHRFLARDVMCQLNDIGTLAAQLAEVTAMTDVTGFGLAGHLLELCEGSGVNARLYFSQVPCLGPVTDYLALGCVPGGTHRNFASYGQHLPPLDTAQRHLLCDPQTSGGLLISVRPEGAAILERLLQEHRITPACIGSLIPHQDGPRVELLP
ncbi:MAG: selenide, water dikinase SelD [Pseudomonadales bacterium]|jgi:selenide,water dikinase|nr:selenide, water dikinase SelD [Pseudomonadales bacterium]